MAKVAEQQETKKAQFFSASESAADSASLVMVRAFSFKSEVGRPRNKLYDLFISGLCVCVCVCPL